MIEEMKATVEKEGKEDLEAYDEYKCWCNNGRAEKEKAIEYATGQIAEIEAFLGEAAGKEGELKTVISTLEGDIASDNAAIAQAMGVREKEAGEFATEESDLKNSLALLKDAIETIKKATGGAALTQEKVTPEVSTALVQVRNVVTKHIGNFEGVMQKDLYDMMGAFNHMLGQDHKE